MTDSDPAAYPSPPPVDALGHAVQRGDLVCHAGRYGKLGSILRFAVVVGVGPNHRTDQPELMLVDTTGALVSHNDVRNLLVITSLVPDDHPRWRRLQESLSPEQAALVSQRRASVPRAESAGR
ncbi:MAG: hypothetical protein ACFE0O_13710 [Opitutales bacterium]